MAVDRKRVGVSILTSGARREALERCVSSLLSGCLYRPLVIGVYNNGSTDDTEDFVTALPETYGVQWRAIHSDVDQGCAHGTNRSIELVSDCECQIHLESDFEHLSPEESGDDGMWMYRAVDLLESGDCDYLYLRRMRDEAEAGMHWWDQWMPKVTEESGSHLRCPTFWWSNNPSIFRLSAMLASGVLPLDQSKDGPKGTAGWSRPELDAARPPNAWLHRWGVFVHERIEGESLGGPGCGSFAGHGCKYGFMLKDGHGRWCRSCDCFKGLRDMESHRERFGAGISMKRKTVAFHLNQLEGRGTDTGSYSYARYNEEILGNRSVFVVPRSGRNKAIEKFKDRFEVRLYDDWGEVSDILSDEGADLLHMRKSGEDDGLVSCQVRTAVHCAFPAYEPHGDVYAYISEWLAGHASRGRSSWVPHVVEPMPVFGDLREELGIPPEARVFGRYGGRETFDLGFAKRLVGELASEGLWFIFMGTDKFCDAPNVVFLDASYELERKSRFVSTCDAMLHARERGETYGLAIAEFSAMGRPVLTWRRSPEQAHLRMLGGRAVTYDGQRDLRELLLTFDAPCGPWWDTYTEQFSPAQVMKRFRSVFL